MVLPDGFTGFRWRDDAPLPSVDVAVFKAGCHAAARMLGGRVVAFRIAAETTPNFHEALLEWGYGPQRVLVLCNRAHWLVSFCRPRPDYSCLNEYVEAPELAAALSQVTDWRILSQTDCESEVDEATLAAMSRTDRRVVEEAMRMKKPNSFGDARMIGDFVFHFSD
jgi:hypothetical protein